MSYLKPLNTNDVTVIPFTVNKQFSSSLASDNPYGIQTNNTASPISRYYQSAKHLFYSNYTQTGSDGRISESSLPIRNPDGTITGERDTTNYDNREQSSFELRYISDGAILSTSIPQNLYGNYIKPGSLSIKLDDGGELLTDDSEGNLIFPNYLNSKGNILYKEGLILITSSSNPSITNFYNFIINGDIYFSSSLTIYETQYRCTIRANEFNYSLNPSLKQSGSLDQYQEFVTGSDFSPYVTTVGLYNENQELLAVAKLSQPLPTSQTTDTTIVINLDR